MIYYRNIFSNNTYWQTTESQPQMAYEKRQMGWLIEFRKMLTTKPWEGQGCSWA